MPGGSELVGAWLRTHQGHNERHKPETLRSNDLVVWICCQGQTQPSVMLNLDEYLGWSENHLRDKSLGVTLKDYIIRLIGVGRPTSSVGSSSPPAGALDRRKGEPAHCLSLFAS